MGSLAGSNQFAKARKNSRSVITNFNSCQSYEWPTILVEGVCKKKIKVSVKIMLNPVERLCRQNLYALTSIEFPFFSIKSTQCIA